MILTNRSSMPHGGSQLEYCRLFVVWEVNETKRYDVPHGYVKQQLDYMIAIRTLNGHGRLFFRDNQTIDLVPGSLIIISKPELIRYRCEGDIWQFWWFEFDTSREQFYLPVNTPLNIDVSPKEHDDFKTIFQYLQRETITEQKYATSVFNMLLYRWMIQSEKQKLPAYHNAITKVLDRIHSSPENQWSIYEMAKYAGMSERNFRHYFSTLTGLPPKKYFEQHRLQVARELLKLQIYNIKQISERFGYSSPFHFTKNFTKLFGYPPSKH